MTALYVDDTLGNDGNAGTSPGAGNAWKTLGKAAATMADDDLVNVINTSDYVITTAVNWVKRGLIRGYQTTPGDSGKYICRTSTNSINLHTIGTDGVSLENGHLKHQASTRGIGVCTPSANRMGLLLKDFTIEGCTRGIDSDFIANFEFYAARFINIKILNCTVYGIIMRGGYSILGGQLIGNAIGIRLPANLAAAAYVLSKVIIANSTSHGIHSLGTANTAQLSLDQCIIFGNGGDGIKHETSTLPLSLNDSIIYGNLGKGLEAGAAFRNAIRNTAFGANVGGAYNTTYYLPENITEEITLTVNPFVDSANLDFNINNDAGGGALLRASNYTLAP